MVFRSHPLESLCDAMHHLFGIIIDLEVKDKQLGTHLENVAAGRLKKERETLISSRSHIPSHSGLSKHLKRSSKRGIGWEGVFVVRRV